MCSTIANWQTVHLLVVQALLMPVVASGHIFHEQSDTKYDQEHQNIGNSRKATHWENREANTCEYMRIRRMHPVFLRKTVAYTCIPRGNQRRIHANTCVYMRMRRMLSMCIHQMFHAWQICGKRLWRKSAKILGTEIDQVQGALA